MLSYQAIEHYPHNGMHTIKITLQYGKFKQKLIVKISGDCTGWGVLAFCVESIFDDYDEITLVNDDGEILTLYNPEDKSLILGCVVGVQIIDWEPESEVDD